MFKIQVNKNAKTFQETINTYAILTDEATLNITAEGISFRAMDPSRVAMVDGELSKEFFDGGYTCAELTKIAVNLSELLKLLKRAGKDESVELTLDDKTGRLNIAITGKYTRNFNMPTLQPSEEEVPTPRISFNVKAKLTTSGLKQAIDDAALVSDHVKIEADKDGVKLLANGDLMNADITLEKGSDTLLDIEVKEQAKAIYSLSYITEIIKAAASLSDIVTIEFSTDMPIKADFPPPTNIPGKLTFYLAPRIEME